MQTMKMTTQLWETCTIRTKNELKIVESLVRHISNSPQNMSESPELYERISDIMSEVSELSVDDSLPEISEGVVEEAEATTEPSKAKTKSPEVSRRVTRSQTKSNKSTSKSAEETITSKSKSKSSTKTKSKSSTPPKTKSKSSTPPKAKSKSSTPPKTKSKSSKSKSQPVSKSQEEEASESAMVVGATIPISDDVNKSVISNAELMHNLSQHILGSKTIKSAKDCLNEINNFRKKQIEKLLGSRGRSKVGKVRMTGVLRSLQPEGNLAEIIEDVVDGYKTAISKNDESASRLSDGYLEWIGYQMELVIPKAQRKTASDLINSRLEELIGEGEWTYFTESDDGKEVFHVDREAIRAAVAQQTESVSEKRLEEKLSRAREIEERARSQLEELKEPPLVAEKAGGRKKKAKKSISEEEVEEEEVQEGEERGGDRIPKKKLRTQLIDSLFYAHELAAVGNGLIEALSLDNQPTTGSAKEWKEYVDSLRQFIAPMEEIYSEMKKESDPFFTEYSENNLFAVPMPERPLLSQYQYKNLVNKNAHSRTSKIYLLDWIENVYRAYANNSEEPTPLTAGLLIAGNMDVKNNGALIDTDSFAIATTNKKPITIIATPKGDLTDFQNNVMLLCIAYLMAWLADNHDNVINLKMKSFPDLNNTSVRSNVPDVRDWLREQVCGRITDNEYCKMLFKTLKNITGPPENNIKSMLKRKLKELNLAIVEGGQEQRKEIDFAMLCDQCREGQEREDCVQEKLKTGLGDAYIDGVNADLYAKALLPNNYLVKRSKRSEGGKYENVDLRENAVLLVAVKTNYELAAAAELRVSVIGKADDLSVQLNAGEWKSAEAFAQALTEASEGRLLVTASITDQSTQFPKFTLRVVDGASFSIDPSSSLELIDLLGLNPENIDKATKEKTSSKGTIATNRSQGFLLALRSKGSFPKRHGSRIQGPDGADSIALANSIELDAICSSDSVDANQMKSLLLLWFLANPAFITKVTREPKIAQLIMDLPKAPVLEEFERKTGGDMEPAAVPVNQADAWRFWDSAWKFNTAFPKELSMRPKGAKSKDVYALNEQVAAFSELPVRYKLVPGNSADELKKYGPQSKDATMWTGLMLRLLPSAKELQAIARAVL